MNSVGCAFRVIVCLGAFVLGACLQDGRELQRNAGDPECPDLKATGGYYVSRTPLTCQTADYHCEYGFAHVAPDCGCGCAGRADCPKPGPDVRFISDDPDQCDTIEFACQVGETSFNSGCGCGCILGTSNCSAANDAERRYLSRDPARCAVLDFECANNDERFDDACGCGCVPAD